MALTLSAALDDPEQVRIVLESSYGHRVTALRRLRHGLAIDLELRPPPDLDTYPVERARITVSSDQVVSAYPLGQTKSWKHRNPSPACRAGETPWHTGGTLCLYYRDDPRELRWVPDDGLKAYVHLVYRHLIYEEYFRRNARWPIEDAPHGHTTGAPHPIRTDFMREMLRQRAAANSDLPSSSTHG